MPRFRPRSNIASCDCPAVTANCSRRLTHYFVADPDRSACVTFVSESHFYRAEFPKAQHLPATSTWWTGEDSNLRSPQGAADLQSAGFSHSPTRPRKTRPSRQRQVQETFVPFFVPFSNPILSSNAATTSENTKRTRVKRHQPVDFILRIRSASFPRKSASGAGGGN